VAYSLGRRGIVAGAAAAAFPIGVRAQAPDPRRGGTLVMLGGGTTRHVNGALQSGTAAGVASTQIFASPLRFDANWNPQPYLAERWELAPDGMSLTLHLVRNALFHDGTPVTSADVAFTIDVIQKNHPFKPMLEPVTGVGTPDAYTAVIRMSRPHPAILMAMCPGLCPVLPKHIYGDGQDLQTHPANTAPIGCGPFRAVRFSPSDGIVLERFDKFFISGRPYLDRIVQRTISDNSTSLLALEQQEINYIPFVQTPRDADRLAKQANLQFSDKGFEGIGAINWIVLNCAKKPLDDKRVRQAIAYLADRPRMLRVLLGPRVKEALTPIHPGSNFYSPEVNTFPYDLKKAEGLLDEAGHKRGADGTRFKLVFEAGPGVVELGLGMLEFLKVQLKRAGIEAEIRMAPDFPTWAQRISGHEFDVTIATIFNWGDPVIGVHRTYLTRNIRKGLIFSNDQSYSNPKADALMDAAAIEVDPARRRAIYREFQQVVTDDAPLIFLHAAPYTQAAHKGLRNLPETVWGPMSPLDEV